MYMQQYQTDFSKLLPEAMYNQQQRRQKAAKILAVLSDALDVNLSRLAALDVGCSTGIMANHLAGHFAMMVGMDIDSEAVRFAVVHNDHDSAFFLASDALDLPIRSSSVDVAICAHVYEHVPDARRMMKEIFRVLKPGGVCFFSAGNRLSLMEPHHRLPLLSVIPKAWAHRYLQVLDRGAYYYEKHLTYWELRRLVSEFQLTDYTRKIIENPEKYHATDVCPPASRKQRLARLVCRFAHWLNPTYIFLLKK